MRTAMVCEGRRIETRGVPQHGGLADGQECWQRREDRLTKGVSK